MVRCCPDNRHAATTAPCPVGANFGSKPGQGVFLVGVHETAIAGDIRRQYSRKSPFHALSGQTAPE
jgi:hypothetical protein